VGNDFEKEVYCNRLDGNKKQLCKTAPMILHELCSVSSIIRFSNGQTYLMSRVQSFTTDSPLEKQRKFKHSIDTKDSLY
jgi:hypothetical protein